MTSMPNQRPPVPMPADWARIHARLAQERLDRGLGIPAPPVPLILAGAAFSTATAIRQRWSDLFDWAATHGLMATLLALLPPPPDIDVAANIAGVSEDGRGWWPEYGVQDHPPRAKPTADAVLATLKRLQQHWASVVGDDLVRSTRPLRFSGRKRRRLIVAADPNARPPWGCWGSRFHHPSGFRGFRHSINSFIAPMEVDHVHFNLSAWQRAILSITHE